MTSAIDYTAATRNAENVFTTTLDSWKNGLNSVTDQFRGLPSVGTFPQLDVTDAVERQFAFIKQVVDLNHQYARQLAEVASTLTGVTRQQIESVGNVVRDQVKGVSELARDGVDTVEQNVREQADKAEQAVREQAEKAEQAVREQARKAEEAERQQAREAAKAERQERKEAHDKARERYQSLNKAELTEEAAKRDLPRTGTVDELIERLVEADTK
jgi:hypothetical protein